MVQDKSWVDFKAIKEAVSMKMVLDHYGYKPVTGKGDEWRGYCPIHKGNKTTFSYSVGKNAFQCFSDGCKARGNVLDFVAKMEGCSVHEAAIKLAGWFKVGESEPVQSTGGKENVEPVVGDQAGSDPNQPINYYDFIISQYEGERELLLARLTFLDEGIAIAKALRDTQENKTGRS
jgi:hypothetical protein